MLDAKSLEVLQSLKSDIKAAKDILSGTVKGTGKSFGFAVADDGKEYFLPPDEMSKVFPGDRVTFTVTEQDDGKSRAELESLESSDFQEFNGVYYVRGKAQGVEPFSEAFASWLFVPPKKAAEAQHNDIVKAKVIRHPWKTGKAQAEVIETLGSADNNRSWYSMTLAEQQVPEKFTSDELNESAKLAQKPMPTAGYEDCTDLPFITIDSATTQDMDDALYAKPTDSGWQIQVAIADASYFIESDSLLERAAKNRLNTTYLPGLTLPMLPEELSNNAISLVEGEVRPVLIFLLDVDQQGAVTSFDVKKATIKNTGKLSYAEVSHWLDTQQLPDEHATNLSTLFAATQQMAEWRKTHANQMQDRVDYRIRVDDSFNVTAIETEMKNSARELVEETMVATNRGVAQWLQDQPALFMAHKGFKADRETELKGLLRDYAPKVAELNGHNLPEFISMLKKAKETENFPLLQVLQKRFDRGYWSASAEPHFGLGFESYTNATSPIRKYTDLRVHRIIKAKLANESLSVDQVDIDDINERNNQSRQVANAIENRLRLKWLAQHAEGAFNGTIVHLNANGLMVQLQDNGAVGFVDLRKKKDDYSYDPLRMLLKFEDFNYQLGQELTVTVRKIDSDNLLLALS